MPLLHDADYRQLLEFRDGLRRFLKWSADRAREVGLTPGHHQLLLVVRGHGHRQGPTIGEVAAHLILRPHSAVELVDRGEEAGLVVRRHHEDDQRSVRVVLTDLGRAKLAELSELHLAELGRLAPRMAPIWSGLPEGSRARPDAG